MLVAALQTNHQDAIAGLEQQMQQTVATQDSLKGQLAEHAATIQQQLEQLQELNANIADLQGQLGECACTSTCLSAVLS
jgi:septal ring factor EnvC (AmiA/AmiB activator)